jgi:hypothetical protein
VARLRELAGDDVVGVYAGGSYALGAYEEGRSDLDIAAVLVTPPSAQRKQDVVDALRHEALPCPARGLEFVLYTQDAVRTPNADAGFEVNLNTGDRMPFRVDFEPDPIEAHWFPIDRSILSRHGIALFGPPATEVFAPTPRGLLLPLLAESLRRQADAKGRGDDVVLNACRTWMYIEEGVWGSKPAAGVWAVTRTPLAAQALEARQTAAELQPEEVRTFVERVLALVEAAARGHT